MKKLNSDNLNLIYADGIIRLYYVGEKESKDKKPVIFINGQMEHRIQAFETATNITKSSCFQYSYTHQYDEKIHSPYIMVYDYPITTNAKGKYDTRLFAKSLINAISVNKLENVDIIGLSVGGMIGIRCSNHGRIDEVRAIHPPILSSPLANLDLLHDNYSNFNAKEKFLYGILKLIVNPKFGFQQENAQGYLKDLKEYELDKIKIFASQICSSDKVDFLSKELAEFIYKITGKKSDGVVCHDKDLLNNLGFDVIEAQTPTSHFGLNSEYVAKAYKTLEMVKK